MVFCNITFLIQVIKGAGHHVYADKSDVFNKHVSESCALIDDNKRLMSMPNIKMNVESNEKQSSQKEKKTEQKQIQKDQKGDADVLEVEPSTAKTS